MRLQFEPGIFGLTVLRLYILLSILIPSDYGPAVDPFSKTYLPIVISQTCNPQIIFSYVPPMGESYPLEGKVTCIQPEDYRLAIFIEKNGWYTKPYWAQPLTTIQAGGSWTANITTGSQDEQALKVAAFLVPAGYTPPAMKGETGLPEELYQISAAYLIVERLPGPRRITFAGRSWTVRAASHLSNPGPNFFSDHPEDVWVDEQGYLHLRLVFRGGVWRAAEVVSEEVMGYGTYSFVLDGVVDRLDANAVLGLFTYDDAASQAAHREIDVELSQWGDANGQNAQYVVQPSDLAGNRYRYSIFMDGPVSTHQFVWSPDGVQFSSYLGDAPVAALNDLYQSWLYAGPSLPAPGQAHIHINLWLMKGRPPVSNAPLEVVIKSFSFTPSQ